MLIHRIFTYLRITYIRYEVVLRETVITGDFNVNNLSWIHRSAHTTAEGQYVELFAAHNHLAQLVNGPTYIPCIHGHQSKILDLFLTSHPDKHEMSITTSRKFGSLYHFWLLFDYGTLQRFDAS